MQEREAPGRRAVGKEAARGEASGPEPGPGSRLAAHVPSEEIWLPLPGATLPATLTLPRGARGLVLFAHGSGSSRFSPRNRHVAACLQAQHLGTLLLDLLTRREEEEDEITRALRFDIELLAARLVAAIDALRAAPRTAPLPIGLFGASTGAAAALIAAAQRPAEVAAVVSRGGRPDLAGAALARVTCPTLLLVGEADLGVLELNERALRQLPTSARLQVVPGATHLFEEPGALDQVAALAARWFLRELEGGHPGGNPPEGGAPAD